MFFALSPRHEINGTKPLLAYPEHLNEQMNYQKAPFPPGTLGARLGD